MSEMTEFIGFALVVFAVLLGTSQIAYAYGEMRGTKEERARADVRVRGVLAAKAQTPRARKKRAKRDAKPKMIKVGEVSVPALIVKTSKKG